MEEKPWDTPEERIPNKDSEEHVDHFEIKEVVLEYLIHHCHQKTARALFQSTCDSKQEKSFQSIESRKRICQWIEKGEILEVLHELKKNYPIILEKNGDIVFQLKCQHYIELIRQKKTKEALQYSQEELGDFGSKNNKYFETLQDLMTLLAYDHPDESPVGNLMKQEERMKLYGRINSAILESLGASSSPKLDLLMKHITLVKNLLQGDMQTDWSIHDFLEGKTEEFITKSPDPQENAQEIAVDTMQF